MKVKVQCSLFTPQGHTRLEEVQDHRFLTGGTRQTCSIFEGTAPEHLLSELDHRTTRFFHLMRYRKAHPLDESLRGLTFELSFEYT